MSNYGRDGLTAYEYLLDKDALAAYIEREARDRWPLRKGAGTPFTLAQGLQLLFAERPALYQRHCRLVQKDTGTGASPQEAAVRKGLTDGRDALQALEALASRYVGQGLAPADALAHAVADRPDLYRAHAAGVQKTQR
jgi:hypothetical protein